MLESTIKNGTEIYKNWDSGLFTACLHNQSSDWLPTINEAVDQLNDMLELEYVMDGNMWCARKKDFVNLQTSPAGFGKTTNEAYHSFKRSIANEQ